MGAWGVGVFENDDANDWVYELEQSSDLGVVLQALTDVVTGAGEDGPESMESAAALAAAEVVATLNGRPGDGLPDDVAKWVATIGEAASPELVDKARRAVRQVLTASELKDQWDESGTEQGEEWEAQVEDLIGRLE
jgi:predicted RNA polymerase sigma factor